MIGIVDQPPDKLKKFKIGPLRRLSQVITAHGRLIRAVVDGIIDNKTGTALSYMLNNHRAAIEAACIEGAQAQLEELARLVEQRGAMRLEDYGRRTNTLPPAIAAN
jgi:hypothetical protein